MTIESEKLMLRKTVSLLLAVLLTTTISSRAVYADANVEKAARLAAKVKEGVAALGIGKEAQVEIKLHDKSKLRGYISQANDNDFVVVSATTGESETVSYSSVKQIKGNNLSTGARIAIGIAIGVGILVALYFLIKLGFRERDCDSRRLGEC